MNVIIEESWKRELSPIFSEPFFSDLTTFVKKEYQSHTIFPPPSHIFRAFNLCSFDNVKVVIIGQDPYHNDGQANGLSFAVNEKTALPPSLQNIFKEIKNDIGVVPYNSGDLSRWARQGVLMLNAVLTVRAHAPGSHAGKGWEKFTDAVIQLLSTKKEHIVYMLWGKYAQEKGKIVDQVDNLVLTSGHPSPYSAHLFFGNHHFSKANLYLEEHSTTPIDWR